MTNLPWNEKSLEEKIDILLANVNNLGQAINQLGYTCSELAKRVVVLEDARQK